MGLRPLRQTYDRDGDQPPTITIDPAFAIPFAAWQVHRARFDAALRSLTPTDWSRPTRCSEWSVREVIGHLVVVDGFWALTLGNLLAEKAPFTMLDGFDPTSSTDDLVTATLATPIDGLVDQFSAATVTTAELLDSLTDEQWHLRCESPLGHLPATCILGHMLWDSWLHERDIFVPMGSAPRPPVDELIAVTWFTFCFAGLQGGLLGDAHPVGAGPDAAIDCTLAFDDLAGTALRVRIGEGVEITGADPSAAISAGSAIALVDAFAGRGALDDFRGSLPTDLFAQLTRAAGVLV